MGWETNECCGHCVNKQLSITTTVKGQEETLPTEIFKCLPFNSIFNFFHSKN